MANGIESTKCARYYTDALKDGAFDFLLCLAADIKSSEWTDPARHGLRVWLVRRPMSGHALMPDTVPFSVAFQNSLMEQLETFVEGFITNLPDVLRKLRNDEDEQRQQNHEHEHDLDLERFVVIISYAFEDRPDAAFEAFWDVPDGAFYGFLQWASKRASTPLVSAFCELLQALSGNEACADAAHRFLLDDNAQQSRMRKTLALTWSQIFRELTFFANKIRDQPAIQPAAYRTSKTYSDPAELEPESTLMLESYLRLISRLCEGSKVARLYMLQNPNIALIDLLLQLASSSIPSRLRACAFTAIRSLLTDKTKAVGELIWQHLDSWISGGHAPGLSSKTVGSSALLPPVSAEAMLRKFDTGFEEPVAFIRLLTQLVSPYQVEAGLQDHLPFQESLGSSNRLSGIDPYIDFVIGQIFTSPNFEDLDLTQLRVLRLECLRFITTCLASFNEDLLIFANNSNINIEVAVNVTSLEQYAMLHPFSRVMDWMLNDNVMASLFATIHQDLNDVINSAADSPLVLSVMAAIQAVVLVMNHQTTYVDIVRPIVRQRREKRSRSTGFSCFEDGILNHIEVIADLGLLCGCDHHEVATGSLALLTQLCSSPKITTTTEAGRGLQRARNRIISAFELAGATAVVSRMLVTQMDNDDILDDADPAPHEMQIGILNWLIACLESSPTAPNIAHLLLGFECSNDTVQLNTDPESPFCHGTSLLHSLIRLSGLLPLAEVEAGTTNVPLRLMTLHLKCLQVLWLLWRSPLCSEVMLEILQVNNILADLLLKQIIINDGVLWDGFESDHPDFMISTAHSCLVAFLLHRSLVFQLAAAEMRRLTRSHQPTLKAQVVQALLGSIITDSGVVQNPSVFALGEFMDLALPPPPALKPSQWLKSVDTSSCLEDDETCNISKLAELLSLRRAELQNLGHLDGVEQQQSFEADSLALIQHHTVINNTNHTWSVRLELLRSWVQVLVVMIQSNDLSKADRSALILQVLQAALTRLEANTDRPAETEELGTLIRVAVCELEVDEAISSDLGQAIDDKLLNVFNAVLRAIIAMGASPTIKEILYGIVIRYLDIRSDIDATIVMSQKRLRSVSAVVKSVGDRVLEILCDDALNGEAGCRVSALLLLSSLLAQGMEEQSTFVLEAFLRTNFVSLLVQTVPNMRREMAALYEGARSDEHAMQLAIVTARNTLLTTIARNRKGANSVVHAGLFHAIKTSDMFALDPELDLGKEGRVALDVLTDSDLNDPLSLPTHYKLLTCLMRLILAITISRGFDNEQSIFAGRKFLSENRSCVLNVLKRAAGRNLQDVPQSADLGSAREVEDLADAFMCLISAVGFIEVSCMFVLVLDAADSGSTKQT